MNIHDTSHTVYEGARTFFAQTVKSDNKRYGSYSGVDPVKIQRRQANRSMASTLLTTAWNQHMVGKTPLQYGMWIHSQGTGAAGNCTEMSCLALYYFAFAQQNSPGLGFPVRMVGVPNPGDHVFLIAGDLPTSIIGEMYYQVRSTVSLFMLCNSVAPNAESYAVDVWAGIFCHTRRYPQEFLRKMAKWSSRGKEVRWAADWEDPGVDSYTDSFVNSKFYLRDVSLPFTR